MEQMETKQGQFGKEWEIFALVESEINHACAPDGIILSKEEKDEVARKFQKMFGMAVENYEEWLKEAIKLVVEEREDGTSGQDRKNYTDTQDRKNYTVKNIITNLCSRDDGACMVITPTKKTEAIGCDKFDDEHPELTRCCGDILFSNKIYLCKDCFEKYKDDKFWKGSIIK